MMMPPYLADDGRPLWPPRLAKKTIADLYHQDAMGIQNVELIEEVGIGLLLRCHSMLTVRSALRGDYECPGCLNTWSQPEDKRDPMHCPKCGWSLSWEDFKATYQRKQLHPGGAREFIEEYVSKYPQAKTSEQKMILIDTLIHRFHSEGEIDESPTRPAAVNLIQGKMKDVVAFLDDLTYSENSTSGVRETLSGWRTKWNNSHFTKPEEPDAKGFEKLKDRT